MPRTYHPVRGGNLERAALDEARRRCSSILSIAAGQLDGQPAPQYRRIWIGVRAAVRIAQIGLDRLGDAGAGVDCVDAAQDQVVNVLRLVLVGLDLGPAAGDLRALRLVELEAGEVSDRLRVIRDIRR
jgi:hypothetical protein